jgi:hypothetical protein
MLTPLRSSAKPYGCIFSSRCSVWHGYAGHAVEAVEGFDEDAWCMEEEASGEAKAKPARLRAAALLRRGRLRAAAGVLLRCVGGEQVGLRT